MKALGKILICMVLIVGAIAMTRSSDLAPGVTLEGVRELRGGMSRAEVLKVLGVPYLVEMGDEPNVMEHHYSRQPPTSCVYPMLTLEFRGNSLAWAEGRLHVGWGAAAVPVVQINEHGRREHELFEKLFF